MPFARGRLWVVGLLLVGGGDCGGNSPTAAPAAAAPTPPPRRPNFVFLLTDDLNITTSDTLPRLPALIGQQGRTFSRFYVTQSLCAPSRASILTGQYPHNHRVLDNTGHDGGFGAFHRGQEASTLAVWLRAAGYRTALVGKYINDYPTAARPDYVAPGWDEWQAQLTTLSQDHYVNYFLNENGTVQPYGNKEDEYETDVLSRKATAFIGKAVNDKKPFFLYLATDAPHLPAISALRHATLMAGTQAPRVPSFNEANVINKPAFVRNTDLLQPKDIKKLDHTETDRVRTMLAVEDMLASVISVLAANNVLDQTYVVFTSDNGIMLGQHRLALTKNLGYEECIRQPLIVMGPDISAATRDDEHFVLNVDFAPTLLELAGVPVPSSVDGRSFAPLLRGESVTDWRKDLLAESISYTGGVSATLRNADYAYTELESNEHELYDMRTDPFQLNNLYRRADPILLQALSARLAQLTACRGASCRN